MKISIIYLIALSLITLTTTSCGSRNDTFQDFDDNILNNLRQKKQRECLIKNTANIRSLKNKALSIFTNAQVKNFWEFTYSRDNTSADTDDTTRVVSVHIENILGADISTEITFIVVNEDGSDGESETNDQKRFIYNYRNHIDHIQSMAIKACENGEDVIISDSLIQFRTVEANETRLFFLNDQAPAFLARFFSYVSQVRSNDTDESLGSITANMALATKAESSRALPSISSSIEECPVIANIDFNALRKGSSIEEPVSGLTNEELLEAFILLPIPPDQGRTLESVFKIQDDMGITGC